VNVPADYFAISEFLAQAANNDAGLWTELESHGALTTEWSAARGFGDCYPGPAPPVSATTMDAALRWLRRWRRREMAAIAYRDLAGLATVDETLAHLSGFADAAIRCAYEHAWAATALRFGQPRDSAGNSLPLVVVGMGKLGGGELNFSSDIDLVFLFPEGGETDHAAPVSNDEFFIRLGQQLIQLLAQATVDGFVFRVDMRLRPFGDSGPLACSFAAFEDYLLQHGRDWERYAWVKARAIVGAAHYAELFASAVRPFVFRRYLDFGVFESLREMKGLIEKQVARRDLQDDIKLGPGGIREIEFIVQALQLIRGGQDARLQTPGLLAVLPRLAGSRLLPESTIAELAHAYRHLRVLENRLQMLRDAQVHQLPTSSDDRQRLAIAMGAANWQQLLTALDRERTVVRGHFAALALGAADESRAAPAAGAAPETAFHEAVEAARLLEEFRGGPRIRRLDATGERRLNALLASMLPAIAQQPQQQQLVLLLRVLQILEAIGQRSSYFALLVENQLARRRFIELCSASDFLAKQMAAFPLLLDELLDERLFAQTAASAEMAADLEERLARIDAADDERVHEALCQFKNAAQFRVAVADLSGRLPLMQVSDRLTDIAGLIVQQAMRLAWRQMVAQFGTPCCGSGNARRAVRICALGYGKLGGFELGYASDLDLVFLHDSTGEQQETTAPQPVDNQVFFIRLAQRILHLLSMHSAAGRLYEVDVRLRPSGKGGMLITGIEAFRDYQRSEAWTWEHQALLHARAVAGDPELRARFQDLRMEAVTQFVRREQLRDDVRSMRERMRRELDRSGGGEFDLKQGVGGIADIEFLAQYWALLHAARWPPVAFYSDTIRQLESLASAALVAQEVVDQLTNAYRAYRSRGHHRSLRDELARVPDSEFAADRAAVTRIWQATFDGGDV
jgi:glutamate-ammonia-ligase adenylyltransferase